MTVKQAVEQDRQLDIELPGIVEISIRDDRQVIWVNVDGVCLLRISGLLGSEMIIDGRREIVRE